MTGLFSVDETLLFAHESFRIRDSQLPRFGTVAKVNESRLPSKSLAGIATINVYVACNQLDSSQQHTGKTGCVHWPSYIHKNEIIEAGRGGDNGGLA